MLLVDYLYVILYHNNNDNNVIIMFNICIVQIGNEYHQMRFTIRDEIK